MQRIKKAQIDKFIKYYGVDELTEYDDTDFDDNGGTVVSQAHLDYYLDSLEENSDDCQWQLNESISKKQVKFSADDQTPCFPASSLSEGSSLHQKKRPIVS